MDIMLLINDEKEVCLMCRQESEDSPVVEKVDFFKDTKQVVVYFQKGDVDGVLLQNEVSDLVAKVLLDTKEILFVYTDNDAQPQMETTVPMAVR